MRSFVAVSLFAILTGCYTQQSLESKEPYTILEVALDPETLAECFPRKLDIWRAKQITRTDDDTAIVLSSIDPANPVFHYQMRLSPIADGHSEIVVRTHHYIGGPMFNEEEFEAIAACGEIISRQDVD